ncbi:MAG TPA: hypothetical protein VFF30_12510 [Nitrososphaerales archaeon]|nr:hypothetical protein [Nitrososphaerales archaeon]
MTQTLSFNVTYATVAGSVIRSLINGDYNITIIGNARVFLFFSLIPVNAGFTVVVICPGRTSVQNCTQTARLS